MVETWLERLAAGECDGRTASSSRGTWAISTVAATQQVRRRGWGATVVYGGAASGAPHATSPKPRVSVRSVRKDRARRYEDVQHGGWRLIGTMISVPRSNS